MLVKDLVGQKFGHLTVLSLVPREQWRSKSAYWLCECDCPQKTQKVISSGSLRNGHVQSCGCLRWGDANHDLSKLELTQDVVRELLDYYPETGELFWRWRDRKWFNSDLAWKRWNTMYAGKQAFTTFDRDGYRQGSIFEKNYRAHRIIWLWMTGEWPNKIDHTEHVRDDNRWIVLSNTDNKGNNRNMSLSRRNTSGHVGVRLSNNRKRWRAYLEDNGIEIHLGTFPTFQGAKIARRIANVRRGFHPNHGKPKQELTHG